MQTLTRQSALLLVVISTVVFLPACWFHTESKKQTGLVVINVLDKQEYDDCHIAGSINVPFDEIERISESIDTQADVVLYCSNYMCTASGFAARKLKQRGFDTVSVYEGGTAEWYQNNLPVEGPSIAEYLTLYVEPQEERDTDIHHISMQELAHKMGIAQPSRE